MQLEECNEPGVNTDTGNQWQQLPECIRFMKTENKSEPVF